MVSFGFVPLSLNNGFRSELKQRETQKSIKKIKALIGITAQDKYQLLHRYFILSQFLLLTLCVRRARKVDNAELPRPTAGEKTRQKNINPFPRAYLGNHAS